MFSVSYEINYKELSLGKKLGQGGFGVVYQGTYRHSDVAVKQLLEQNISKEAASEFAAEAVVMAKLRHENIVQFLGYCVSPQYCIVMEYMPQGSLFSVLHSEQPLDWPERFRIAVDIAKGIAVLHCEHILHRDIKSLNVLLDAHRKAKLTDFGLSKVKTETQSKTKGGLVGTFAWMAPELSDEEGQYSSACDIYSLGITFWELATSKTPFAHIDGKRQMMIPIWAKGGKREPIPQDCPKPLADLIQACWATEPSTRPTAEQIVIRLKAVTGELVPKTIEGANSPTEISSPVPSEGSKSTKTTSGSNPPASGPVYPMNSTVSSSDSLSSAKLFDSGDPEAVLKKLKDFFIAEDHKGEETQDLELYNQVLEAHEARLVYVKKKQTHTLCVNDEPLEPKAAIKALSGMIASLKASSGSALQPSQPLPKSPSSQSISRGSPAPSSLPEKSNVSILTPPPNKVEISPVMPKVNPQELGTFLRLVAEGEQEKAKAMLEQNLDLALVPGDVTDLSKRTFRGITAFQYALWALDWHMWTMLLKYISREAANAQVTRIENGDWVSSHGLVADWQNLINALNQFVVFCEQARWDQANITWIDEVGGAQLQVPAHVINEYCHPSRKFYPTPDFTKVETDDSGKWRCRRLNKGEWFTAELDGKTLGKGFAVIRTKQNTALIEGASNRFRWNNREPAGYDSRALSALLKTRQSQRTTCIAEYLKPVSIHRPSGFYYKMSSSDSTDVTTSTKTTIGTSQPQASGPVYQMNSADSGPPVPSSPPEKSNNVLILTPPPKKVEIAPALPKVNPQKLGTFLRLVAEGEQGEAEAMLKENRDFALVPGDVTDLSKRTFRGITAFQYALWALDWHMWMMLLKYLPPEQAAAQAQQIETGSWVREHGIHANWQNLIDAQQKYLDYCAQSKWSEAGTTWVKQVGGAQLLLPAHVVSEYCHPKRSFSPCPDFTKPESNDAWRIRTTDEGEWFSAQYNGGGLGSGFGVCRGGVARALVRGRQHYHADGGAHVKADHQAVVTLYSARQKQRDELLRDLSRAHVPLRAAMS